jgi:DNA-binding transcriptional LysR family regulator
MEIRVLRYVIAVAEEQHFGRAARRAHVAQSALSQQVKQLEGQLGVRLFHRTTRHVAITEAGLSFLEHAHRIVDAADRAAAEMRSLAEGRAGSVSVGFVGTATYDVLPRVAHRVRSELPDVELTLRGELLNPVLLDGLHTGRFDLALIRPGLDTPEGIELHRLRTEKLVAVLPAAHPLAHDDELDLSLLAGESFVMHPSGDQSSIHQHVLTACRQAGFEPPSVTEVGETATLATFVAAGLGVALVPEPVRSLRLDGVVYVDLVDPPTVDLSLARRTTEHSPATVLVAQAIRRCVSD